MSAETFETTYPKKCEDSCHLGPKALEIVGGVLGGNCPGPALFSEETLVFESRDGDDFVVQPTKSDDLDQLACRNPRLVRAVRARLNREVDNVLINSIEMRD